MRAPMRRPMMRAPMAPAAPAMAPQMPMGGMKKGGMASPHARADGIARKGHTKCACGGGRM